MIVDISERIILALEKYSENSLSGRTLFVTGASRGIGRAIALRAAQDGANVVIAAKSDLPHPILPGTIHSVAEEVLAAGGQALALKLDVKDEHAIQSAIQRAAEHFGGIDILINNASAIALRDTRNLRMVRFDLMFGVNVRGTYACSQACIPYLLQSDNAHILNLSPPLNLNPAWFKSHVAYTISKYGMSMCTLGMAEEFREEGVAVNSLWPRTVIATAALNVLDGLVKPENCRTEAIMADAAHAVLVRDSRACSGNFFIDQDVLHAEGVTDFEQYAVQAGTPLMKDLFLDE